MHRTILGVALCAGLAVGAEARAAFTTLQIDLNALAASAGAPFDESFTGTLHLTTDGDASLNALERDGVTAPIGAQWSLDAFTGEINFASGVVTGGFLSLSVTDTITTDTFDADIVAQSGQISAQADQGFFIDGLLFSGLFSGLSFAGVDVSDWFNAQPLTGSFLQFEFSPDEGGSDRDTDLDIFVIVPAPGPAAALGLALGAGALRRRR